MRYRQRLASYLLVSDHPLTQRPPAELGVYRWPLEEAEPNFAGRR